MILWIDAQLSPSLASWITENFGVEAYALRDLGLRDAKDREICLAAQGMDVVVVTKDSDFLELSTRFGHSPQVLWITCGNTSNARIREVLRHTLTTALQLLEHGEPIVEISDAR